MLATCQSATSSHSGRYVKHEVNEGSSLVSYTDKTVDSISGVIDQSLITSVLEPPDGNNPNAIADNLAKARLHKSFYRRMNTWRGGNFIAEIRETIHMLKHPLQNLYKRTYDFAGRMQRLGKVYRARPRDYAKYVADAWLTYVFGIRPLAEDVNDLATALYKLGTSRFDSVKLYGSGHIQTSLLTHPGVSWTVPGHPAFTGQVQDRVEVMDAYVKYKGAIKTLKMDDRLIIQQFGVDVYDIIPALWEGTPFSFLVDYFINVQEVLDGMRLVTAQLAWLNRLSRNERSTEVSAVYGSPNIAPTKWSSVGGGGQTLCRMHLRVALTTLPYPSWQFRIPGLGSLKWLNIAALTQQFRQAKAPLTVDQVAPQLRDFIRTATRKRRS